MKKVKYLVNKIKALLVIAGLYRVNDTMESLLYGGILQEYFQIQIAIQNWITIHKELYQNKYHKDI